MERKEFRIELRRRIDIIRAKYSNNIAGGSWRGVEQTIMDIDKPNPKPSIFKKKEVSSVSSKH